MYYLVLQSRTENFTLLKKLYRGRVDMCPHLSFAACKLEEWNQSKRKFKW